VYVERRVKDMSRYWRRYPSESWELKLKLEARGGTKPHVMIQARAWYSPPPHGAIFILTGRIELKQQGHRCGPW
jgi:hypothetical protein